MSAVTLLNRLESVRQTGPGRWSARCPAHDDKSPSLSVRELSDGRVLIYCFAGCGGDAVMAALGLSLSDLYPDSLPNKLEGYAPLRRVIHPADALKTVEHESMLVAILASDMANGRKISDADARRCAAAAGRINAAIGGTL